MWSYGRLLAFKPQELLLASLSTLRLKPTGSALLRLQAVGPGGFLGRPYSDAEIRFPH